MFFFRLVVVNRYKNLGKITVFCAAFSEKSQLQNRKVKVSKIYIGSLAAALAFYWGKWNLRFACWKATKGEEKRKFVAQQFFNFRRQSKRADFTFFFLNFPKTNLLFKRWKIIISELQTKNFVKREKTWIGVLEIVRIVLGTIELIDYDIIGIEFQCLSTWQASYLLDFGSKPLVKRR